MFQEIIVPLITTIVTTLVTIYITHVYDYKLFRKETFFTHEIESIKILVEKELIMIDSVYLLFPHGGITADLTNKEQTYKNAEIATLDYYKEFVACKFYLNEDSLILLDKIYKSCENQIKDFYFFCLPDSDYPKDSKNDLYKKAVKRNAEIEELHTKFYFQLDSYIKKRKLKNKGR